MLFPIKLFIIPGIKQNGKYNYMKKVLIIALLANLVLLGSAQPHQNYHYGGDKIQIKGKIVDAEGNTPLNYATVSLYKTDSTLVNGTITGKDGSFHLEANPGNYYLLVQFISYQKKYIDNVKLNSSHPYFDAGVIALKAQSANLDEVTVRAEKSQMVVNLDKKVFNVGKDLSNTGQSALDILDNVPSVSVDVDGNISLRGSQNLQILIDGKPSGLISSDNTDVLRNLQGNQIEKIEVITNPSARYEAQGMAGIINIVLKKNQQKGINGSFEVSAGYPKDASVGANVNFRRQKVNYFLNYSLRYRERPGDAYQDQHFTKPDTSYRTVINRDRLRTGLSNRVRAGMDYYINSKNTLTGALMINYSKQLNTTNLYYHDYNISGVESYNTHRKDVEHDIEDDYEFSLNYDKKFESDDHKFTALAQFTRSDDNERNRITQSFDDLIQNYSNDSVQRVHNDESQQDILFQADYVKPFGNKGKFETGVRSELRHISNPYSVDNLISTTPVETWAPLEEFTNSFDYYENVYAAYVQAGNNFGNFSLQLGIRAEFAQIKTIYSDVTNQTNLKDPFPTIHMTYKLNAQHSFQLSYSRRIQRPNHWWLNPFHSFTDSRNIFAGNPNLKPAYTGSYEAGYLMDLNKINLYAGFFYRHSKDAISRLTTIDTNGITYILPYNFDYRNSYGFETNLTLNPAKWWTINGDFNFFRSLTNGNNVKKEVPNGNIIGQNLTSDDYSWNTRLSNKIRMKPFDFQINLFYRAPQQSPQGIRKAFYMLNTAASLDVFKGKGTFTFNVRDVLNSRRFRFVLQTPELNSINEFRWSERTYNLTFNYRLNQKKKMNRGKNGNNGNDNYGGDNMSF